MELVEVLGRMALVFGLLAAVLFVLKRADRLRGTRRLGGLQVLSSTRLGKAATLNIVSVDGRRLVLGVTAQGVNVLAELPDEAADPVSAPDGPVTAVAAPDEPAGAGSFAQLLAAQLTRPTTSPAVAAVAPPTPAAFLRDVWTSVRRRPLESTDVSSDALAAALALAAGPGAVLAPVAPPAAAASASPSPSTSTSSTAPTSADGSATPRARATRRTAPRTDAQRLEEKRPWSRACRTPFRTPDRDAALV